MNRTADLDAALSFVIHRIEEQAKESDEPLNDEQRLLINNLPSSISSIWVPSPDPGPPVPRTIDYERLCAQGRLRDLMTFSRIQHHYDWDFAFAVFQLNNHPMWGLLLNAGMKYRKPLWDQLLLIIAALLFVVGAIALAILAGDQPWTLFQWMKIFSGSGLILLLGYLGSRRMEKWQLQKNIERCRLASRFANSLAG